MCSNTLSIQTQGDEATATGRESPQLLDILNRLFAAHRPRKTVVLSSESNTVLIRRTLGLTLLLLNLPSNGCQMVVTAVPLSKVLKGVASSAPTSLQCNS